MKDNQVVPISTTTHGFLYHVYAKEDTDRKKILYMGEISDDPKYCYYECTGWSILEKCYHNNNMKKIMEVKIA